MNRIGLVGCGVISQAYARKLVALEGIELAACADLERERAEALAKEHGIPRVLETNELIASDEIDVVLNLTIPAAHADVSAPAIEAGKSVYSEKPLATTLEQGRRLVAEATARGVRLGCAPDTFLGAGLQSCRALIDAGAIGDPVAATAFMLSPGPERWHPGPEIFYRRGAGPLFDIGPYYLTALVSLLGPIRRVSGSARITHGEREIKSEPLQGTMMQVEVPTHVSASLEFAGGPIATLVTSFDVQASRHRNIEIYGTEATLCVPDPNTFGGPVQIRRLEDESWSDLPLTHANERQSRGLGLAEMLNAIETGRAHRASGDLALHVLDGMEQILEASRAGRQLELTTACERPEALAAGLADDRFDP